jgi:hypothetical protein
MLDPEDRDKIYSLIVLLLLTYHVFIYLSKVVFSYAMYCYSVQQKWLTSLLWLVPHAWHQWFPCKPPLFGVLSK